MGLDQYLTASKYVGRWEHNGKAEFAQCDAILAALGLDKSILSPNSPSLTVKVTVAYWRKANAIHKWFVETVQDGKDECQASYVSCEQLQELIGECEKALAAKDKAKDILPTKRGFFFGSVEYDEWDFADLQSTVDQIKPLLANEKLKGYEFYYQASW